MSRSRGRQPTRLPAAQPQADRSGQDRLPYQRALRQAHALYRSRDWEQAERVCRDILATRPDEFDALNLLGIIAAQTQRRAEAAELLGRACAVRPDSAAARNNHGALLRELGRLDEAVASYDRAIAIKPDFAEAHTNRGNALLDLGRPDEALASYECAVAYRPDFGTAYYERGRALQALGRPEDAVESYRKATTLQPGLAPAHNNLGTVLRSLQRFEEAVASFERAAAVQPDNGGPLWNLALTLLTLGDFARGWQLHEWRWQSPGFETKPLKTQRPMFRPGRPCERLLVWPEQGIGDEIMFAMLLPEVTRHASRVIAKVDPRLVELFRRSISGIHFLASRLHVPEDDYDCHVPMGSLPMFFFEEMRQSGTLGQPFLVADKARTATIRPRLRAEGKRLCGISWRSRNTVTGAMRSLELEVLVAALAVEGWDFVSLQYGDVRSDIERCRHCTGTTVKVHDDIDNFNDIDGLASLIDACDLVISVDNVTVHLAGALGKSTYMILPFNFDWRWQVGRDDSLWYRSLRLYRQQKRGDWFHVIEKLAHDFHSIPMD